MGTPRVVAVGHCTTTTSRILVVADEGTEAARLAYRDGSGQLRSIDQLLQPASPGARTVFRLQGLAAGSAVTYAVEVGPAAALSAPADLLAGKAARTFRLLPTTRPPRVALLSCHDPHEPGPAQPYELWQRLARQIQQGEVDLLLHAGDQVYADSVYQSYGVDASGLPRIDLQAPKAEADLLYRYRTVYLEAWSHPDVAAVLGSCPSLMMWDDHEIHDGWGSNDADRLPVWKAVFRAAQKAFLEFQDALNPEPLDAGVFRGSTSWACGWAADGLGVLLLDGRSKRAYWDQVVVDATQWSEAASWLTAQAGQGLRHLLVVVGTPPLYADGVAEAVSALERIRTPIPPEPLDDLRDAWVSPNNLGDCQRLFDLLFGFRRQSPSTRVTLLSGDIHVGTVGRLWTHLPDGKVDEIYQVTSSGISRPAPNEWYLHFLLQNLTRPTAVHLVGNYFGALQPLPEEPGGMNLLCRRNYAVLDFADDAGTAWHPQGRIQVTFQAQGQPEQQLRTL